MISAYGVDHGWQPEQVSKRFVGQKLRGKLASKKQALPDGSFPMQTPQDVKNALRAVGRTSPSKRSAVLALAHRRQKSLGMQS